MKKSIDLMLELLELKDKDYNLFMEKLYDAMTSEYYEILRTKLLGDKDTIISLKYMIKYFESKEEYEKCDVLLHILKENK